mmetsp:Transcript_28073/g.97141  ORF Transcript_28073/g.97141 Transcript_28073/m.97141 type:complete len:267 (+) Transcript_28073:376-1176(+)
MLEVSVSEALAAPASRSPDKPSAITRQSVGTVASHGRSSCSSEARARELPSLLAARSSSPASNRQSYMRSATCCSDSHRCVANAALTTAPTRCTRPYSTSALTSTSPDSTMRATSATFEALRVSASPRVGSKETTSRMRSLRSSTAANGGLHSMTPSSKRTAPCGTGSRSSSKLWRCGVIHVTRKFCSAATRSRRRRARRGEAARVAASSSAVAFAVAPSRTDRNVVRTPRHSARRSPLSCSRPLANAGSRSVTTSRSWSRTTSRL